VTRFAVANTLFRYSFLANLDGCTKQKLYFTNPFAKLQRGLFFCFKTVCFFILYIEFLFFAMYNVKDKKGKNSCKT